MLFGEIVNVTLGAIRASKLRSFLTMLGIVIEVAAVITVVALGSGAQRAVSGLVGIFFGLWLARRVALLDAIEALRYE